MNDFSSRRVTKVSTPQWAPVVYGLTWGQLRPFAFLWCVRAMELFLCWSKNGPNATAKIPKIGSIFRHKISYLEKYSNDRVPRSKRSKSSSYLDTPFIGLEGEAIPFAHALSRIFNLRKYLQPISKFVFIESKYRCYSTLYLHQTVNYVICIS